MQGRSPQIYLVGICCNWWMILGANDYRKGLCPVEVSTGHVRIQTDVQEWTLLKNSTCPVKTSTGHKPHPMV